MRNQAGRVLLEGLEARVLLAGNYVVDLLAVYTPQAQVAAGGISAILSRINAEVASTNLALANSLIPVTVRLVAASRVNYVEAGDLGLDLDRMDIPGDGYLDTVPVLRNYFHADAVALFDSQSDYYDEGISYELDPSNPNRGDDAYAVIDQSVPSSHYLLAHELGHVMGAAHAIGDYGGGGATAFAAGYRFYGNDGVQYHDVMAYDPGTTIPYYSNPRITYAGKPEGAANADASRTITMFAPKFSAYRSTPTVIGKIEIATGATISGWAEDPKSMASGTTIAIVIDGVARATLMADDSRTDLTSLLGSSGHGFSYTPSALAAGNHTVKVYALDSVSGTATVIGTKMLTVRKPVGSIAAVNRGMISGWVVDQDTPARGVVVTVTVDGVAVTAAAARDWRPGLISTYGSANHGFRIMLPTLLAGSHRVTLFVTDTETGVVSFIGSRVV